MARGRKPRDVEGSPRRRLVRRPLPTVAARRKPTLGGRSAGDPYASRRLGRIRRTVTRESRPAEPPRSLERAYSSQGGLDQAAGVGFEPTGRLAATSGFQDRPVRPLRHPAWLHCRSGSRGSPSGATGRTRGVRRRLGLLIVPALLGAAVVGAAASAPDSKSSRCQAGFRETGHQRCLEVRLSARAR